LVSQKISKIGDVITVEELKNIFGDLHQYLVIPHYDKSPPITGKTLEDIQPFISAGEVDSAKKFVRLIKDETKLAPVLFSDIRIKENLENFPLRQTFIDCGELTLNAIKMCLKDKTKVVLSKTDGNKLFNVFENGQKLSTGLNVILGKRSSGKTYTLDKISETIESSKYIRQFELVQQENESNEREFKSNLEKRRSYFVDEYLNGLKNVIQTIKNIDLEENEREVDAYLESLLKSAREANRRDLFAKTALFDEVDFPIGQNKILTDLIGSVRQVIENVEYRQVIEKHIDLDSMKRLICELIELLWTKTQENKKKTLINDLVKNIKQQLNVRSSGVKIESVDLYRRCMDIKRVERFKDIVKFLKKDAVIDEENIQGFKVEARKEDFKGAQEIRRASGGKAAFSSAFAKYDDPYLYLRELLDIDGLSQSELYKFFVKISYKILNKDGVEVSGGERSEFRLLQEINDAQSYDVLLIDEPESSFDNLFLKSDVNDLIKKISETMPVVVVTHNSTVGASIGADYLLYASKNIEDGKTAYRIYSGHPSDKELVSVDGKKINSHDVLLNSLEAGITEYDDRRLGYEAVKN